MGTIKGQRHENLKNLKAPDGPESLLVAVIVRVIDDIRHPRPAARPTTSAPTVSEQLQSIEWLLDGTEIGDIADALNLDAAWLHHELLLAAGLVQGTPRLGQCRRPRPKHMHKETRP